MDTNTIAERVLSDGGNVLVVGEDDDLCALRDLGKRWHSGRDPLLIEVDEDVVEQDREWGQRIEMVLERRKA